jgi:hypothetical protein
MRDVNSTPVRGTSTADSRARMPTLRQIKLRVIIRKHGRVQAEQAVEGGNRL